MRRVIEPILAGDLVLGDRIDDDIAFVEDLGLVTRKTGHLTIANPIYHEVIPHEVIPRALAAITQATIYHETAWYVAPDGSLDIAKLVDGFTDFWLQHAEALLNNQPYPEAAPQLVLMAFLQRVVNGGGRIDREYALGTRRIDLCIHWPLPEGEVQHVALELKVWRNRQRDPLIEGREQLAAWLERLGLEHGWLVIFDQRDNALPLPERIVRESLEPRGRTLELVRL